MLVAAAVSTAAYGIAALAIDLAPLMTVGGITAIIGAYIAIKKLGPTNKLTEKQIDALEDKLRHDLLADLDDLRAKNSEALMALSQAQVRLGESQIETNRLQIRYEALLAAKDREIALLNDKIALLEAEVKTLQVRLDVSEGRRVDDRMTRMETRQDVAEGAAQHQAVRNDDTPGHA